MEIKSREVDQWIPDSPGVHSDVVSLGSHVWPALLPAHSSASEPAAPTLARHTYCILSHLFKKKYSATLKELTTCYTAATHRIADSHLPCNLFVRLLVRITICQPTSVALPWLRACSVKLQLLWMCSFPWRRAESCACRTCTQVGGRKRDTKKQEGEERGRMEKSKLLSQQAEVCSHVAGHVRQT